MTVHGIKPPILGMIFRFLPEGDMPAACRISRACRLAMNGVKSFYERQLSLSEDTRLATFDADFGLDNSQLNTIVTRARESSTALLPGAFIPPQDRFEEGSVYRDSVVVYARLTRLWDTLCEHLVTADESAKRRFAIFCREFEPHLKNCALTKDELWISDNNWAVLNNVGNEELNERERDKLDSAMVVLGTQGGCLNLAEHVLKTFLAQERVASRCRRTFHDQRVPDGEKWNLFNSRQNASVRETPGGVTDITTYLAGNRNRTAVQRFIRTEAIILDHEPELDDDLNHLCAAIIAAGLPIPAGTAAQRRRYLNDDANLPHLAQLESLTLREGRRVPPEIGRLRGLRSLTITHGITSLPEELATLPHLSSLEIYHSHFPSIPPILEQLPALSHLSIMYNDPPIRVISEALAKKTQMNTLRAHFWGAVGEFFMERLEGYRDGWYGTYHYLGIDPQHLTDVPFATWFRERFSIPYVPLHLIAVPIAAPLLALGIDECLMELSLSRLFEGLGWLEYVGIAMDVFFIGIGIALFFLISVLPALVIDLAILPINLFINYAIEPLAQLCSPRMVHLQDAPAPGIDDADDSDDEDDAPAFNPVLNELAAGHRELRAEIALLEAAL